jgi:hypothetical protein
MNCRVFRGVALCRHVELDRHFRGAYCLHHLGDECLDDGDTSEKSVKFNVTTRRYIPEDTTFPFVYTSISASGVDGNRLILLHHSVKNRCLY